MRPILLLILSIFFLLCQVKANTFLATQPTISKSGESYEISFTLKSKTNLALCIVDQNKTIIRHLGAGDVGGLAPKPFQQNSLTQKIIWDGKDDDANIVKNIGGCSVLIQLNAKPSLAKKVDWDYQSIAGNIVGIISDPDHNLYVITTDISWGRTNIRVYDPSGQYKKTIAPYSKNTPPQRLREIGQLKNENKSYPIVYNSHNTNVYPFMAGVLDQDLAWHPDGYLVMASALGTMVFQGPERRLLALHPDGGHPEQPGYFGPIIRPYKGFMGGIGEEGTPILDSILIHPTTKEIFLTTNKEKDLKENKKPHTVYRFQWKDKDHGKPYLGQETSGDGENQFNQPRGLAFGQNNQLFVCDYGNNKVKVYSDNKEYLGYFEVKDPWQIKINQSTQNIYILTRAKGSKARQSSLLKFSPFQKDKTPSLIATFENKNEYIKVITLIEKDQKVTVWGGAYTGWNRSDHLIALEDKGASFALKNLGKSKGFGNPLIGKYDPINEYLYISPVFDSHVKVHLKDNKIEPISSKPNSVIVDKSGNTLNLNWRGPIVIAKKDSMGKDTNFTGSDKNSIGPWSIYNEDKKTEMPIKVKGAGVRMGYRGHNMDAKGNIYIFKTSHYGSGKIDVHGPDGKLIKEGFITGLPQGSSSINVDEEGCVYVGVNIRTEDEKKYFSDLNEVAPKETWRKFKTPRAFPWDKVFYNPYMYHWGGIIKFGPNGGKIFEWGHEKKPDEIKPKEVSGDAKIYKSGYLASNIAIVGSEWYQPGFGPIATSGVSWGDMSCSCTSGHFSQDPYGRSYVPDPFTFNVHVIDKAGNRLFDIGSYGNPDDDKDQIHFIRPYSTDFNGGKLVVTDSNNERITFIRLEYEEEKLIPFSK